MATEHKHYRPGSRRGGSAGRMGDHRKMWVEAGKWEFILYMGKMPHEQDDEYEMGTSVFLTITYGGTKKATINLTAMTEEEVKAVKEFVDRATDLAIPVARQRDEAAKEAYENGDDSFIRLYRPVPEIIVREGAFEEHDEGVSE